MANSYDSDDDDLDQGDFTETNVLLGYASRDADDDTITRLGGRPEWLDAAPASASLGRCKACQGMMVLLLQLNGELPEKFPNHERRLYVFACRNSKCRRKDGSVRAVRGVRPYKSTGEEEGAAGAREAEEAGKKQAEEKRRAEKESKKMTGLGDELFGGTGLGRGPSAGAGFAGNPFAAGVGAATAGTNPFGGSRAATSDATAAAAATLPRKFASALNLISSSPSEAAQSNNVSHHVSKNPAPATTHRTATTPGISEPWPPESSLPRAYPVFYLADADYETLGPPPKQVPPQARLVDAGEDATKGGVDKEAFESAMDVTFQRFADRLAQNPEQCIRYEYGGRPLLYSRDDKVGRLFHEGSDGTGNKMPECQTCGAKRVFEVQLTPHAITELEADEAGFDGMEWGTIIVGVCSKDCVPQVVGQGVAGYLEEWTGVQWEELAERKK